MTTGSRDRALRVLYAANLLFLTVHGAYFLLPVYLTQLGAGESQVGAVMAAMGITNAAALVWIYFAGERHGARRLMLAGCLASALSCAGMLLAADFWAIGAMRMLQGLGFCLYFVAANAWLARCCPPAERAKQIGYLGIVTLVTQSAAPPLAEALVALTSFRVLFAVTVALVFGSALAVSRLPAERDAPVPTPAQGPLPSWVAHGVQIGAVALLSGAAYGTVLIFSPLYLQDHGLVPLSLFFTVYAFAAIAVRVVGREWAFRFGNLRVARICFVLLAFSTFALGHTGSAVAFGAFAALFGCGHGLMYPAVAAHSVEVIPGAGVRALTLWSGGFMVGISVGVLAAGLVAERTAVGTAFQWAGVLPLAAALAFARSPAGRAAPQG